MTITWQDAITTGILLAAAGYVVRYAARVIRRKGLRDCSGCCTKCPTETIEPPLVTIDAPPKK